MGTEIKTYTIESVKVESLEDPYRSAYVCSMCNRAGTALKIKTRSDFDKFPWRQPADGAFSQRMCYECAGHEAFYMLRQAEDRVLELEKEVERLKAPSMSLNEGLKKIFNMFFLISVSFLVLCMVVYQVL